MFTTRSAECLGGVELLTRARGQLAPWLGDDELTGMQEAKIRLKRLGFFGLLPWSVRFPVLSVPSYYHACGLLTYVHRSEEWVVKYKR